MKRNHRAQITLAVRQNLSISRAQLARATGLSLACVCGIVDELLAEGVLIETGTLAGQRGRPMQLLQINPDGPLVIGVWLSREAVETVVTDQAANILARRSTSYVPDDECPQSCVDVVADEIKRCVNSTGMKKPALAGIGLAVADTVNTQTGIIEGVGAWRGLPVASMLSEKTGIQVIADNDLRAVALTSIWLGNELRDGGAIYVTISKGVGFAYIDNHSLLRGAHDVAGQFGHTILQPGGAECKCGNRGCLNSLVGDVAFVTSVWPELANRSSGVSASECTELAGKAMQMAAAGDTVARAALAKVTEYMGIAIANAVNLFDPRIVYIGGTLINLDPDLVTDRIRAEALKHVWVSARGVEIRAVTDWKPFLLKGSVGLVIIAPYLKLQEENTQAKRVKSAEHYDISSLDFK